MLYHIRYFIRKRILALITLLLLAVPLFSQAERKYIRQGNREYENKKFSDSEISYRRALAKNKSYPDAIFNTGDALYKQKKFDDAGRQFAESYKINGDKDKKAAGMYNLGNSLLMADKLKESIEAYKNSLKLNPGNMEAKYNLAYAQDLLKQQEQQKQQQQQQSKDQDKKEDGNQDQQQQDQQKQENEDQKNQQGEQKISREDAERLLNALANDEKNVQEKVKRAKAAKSRIRTVKNW